LNNPTVTASSLSQSSQQPYYQKFSWAPRAYTWATRLPWLLTAVALLCFVAMLFAAASKHRALRRTAWLLAVAGIIVSVPKLIVTPVFNAVQKHVPTVNNNSQLQTSFTNLAHSALNGITRTMLIFGISFITVAVIIAVVFILTRKRKPKQPADTPPPPESTPPRPQLPPIHRQTPPRPPLPKRPRLIQ
jgi:preprotein translocase subunit SecG